MSIQNNKKKLQKIYNPDRKTISEIPELLKFSNLCNNADLQLKIRPKSQLGGKNKKT